MTLRFEDLLLENTLRTGGVQSFNKRRLMSGYNPTHAKPQRTDATFQRAEVQVPQKNMSQTRDLINFVFHGCFKLLYKLLGYKVYLQLVAISN